ncbi:MAG: AI-2E family transporter [Bacteroidales bacterium]
MKNNYPMSIRVSSFLLAVILFFYAIIAAKNFLFPIVLGLLFGYLLYPIAEFLEEQRIPRILANLISILFFLVIVGAGLLLVYKQAGGLIDNFPVYRQRALLNIDKFENFIETQFGLSDLRLVDFIRDRVKNIFEAGNNAVNVVFNFTTGTLFRVGILPVYIFLFLFYRTKLANFLLKLVKKEKRLVAVSVLRQFSHVVPRYMGGVSTVVITLMILNSTGLIIVGLDHAILFGIISALFNYIPYFGTLIGGAIPFLFALLTGDSGLQAVHVLILFAIIQFTENNILTPNIVGNNLNLNPMVIIIGLIAGGMVWGIPGMFAVVPLLAMFNILAENIDSLKPYSFLMGMKGARKHAITVENIKKFINRIRRV